MSLVEIGPRFVLTPIRIFEGAFGGTTVFSNPGQHFSPTSFTPLGLIIFVVLLRRICIACSCPISGEEDKRGSVSAPQGRGGGQLEAKRGPEETRGRVGGLQGVFLTRTDLVSLDRARFDLIRHMS